MTNEFNREEKTKELKNKIFIIINIFGNFYSSDRDKFVSDYLKKELYYNFLNKSQRKYVRHYNIDRNDLKPFDYILLLKDIESDNCKMSLNNVYQKLFSIYLKMLKRFGDLIIDKRYESSISKILYTTAVLHSYAENLSNSSYNILYFLKEYITNETTLEQQNEITNRIKFFIDNRYGLNNNDFIESLNYIYDKYHNSKLFKNFGYLQNDLHLIFYKI